MEVETLRL